MGQWKLPGPPPPRPPPQRTCGNAWRLFWLSGCRLEEQVPLASSGQRPGTLLSVLRGRGQHHPQPPNSKEQSVQNASGAEAEKPCTTPSRLPTSGPKDSDFPPTAILLISWTVPISVPTSQVSHLYNLKKNFFWLRWVFIAARELSLVVASGGYSSLRCAGLSLRCLL